MKDKGNKGIHIPKNLTRQEVDELYRVSLNVFEFSKHIYLIHPLRGRVKFDLYPYQSKLLWYFVKERFNIILKFRQAGVTELISMYCLWLAMYHPLKTIQIISIKDRVAKKVLRKIKYMYRNLPNHLKISIINGRPGELGTATDMEFANGSMISSLPTTEEAGRSEALSLLVIDEAAIIRWANTIWASAFPTLSTGGAAIVNSTPFGMGNWYHKTYTDALTGGNPFVPLRLRWDMHPERDITWYNQMRLALGPRRTAQEIDGDFLSSGNTVFDLVDIKAIEDTLQDYIVLSTEYGGNLCVLKEPKPGVQFFIGADVATGRSKDYSAFSIMDKAGEEYAYFKGKISTSAFADLLGKYGKKYNNALVGPETNDIGEAVTRILQRDGYPNLYHFTKLLKAKGEKRPKVEKFPGWLTTTKNRSIIINELEEDIRNDAVIIKDPFFVQEAYTFIYDNNNKPIALGKENKLEEDDDNDETFTDDAILAKSITNFIRKGRSNTVVVAPQ